MKKSLNEHINRMKYLTDYNGKGKKIMNEEAPVQGQPAPAVQAPVQTQQPNNQQLDPNFEKEMQAALNQVMNDLPAELGQLAQTQGNKDGQLGDGTTTAPQATQPTQPTQGTQPIAESELKEAIGMLAAGGVLALPAIANLVGKAASFLGKKVGSGDLNQWGEKAKAFAEKMHHSYEHIIDKVLSPLTKNLDPAKRKVVNKLVFYSIVATFFGFGAGGALHAAGAGKAGLAAEGGLSGVKASELVAAVRSVMPNVLSSLGIS